MPRYYFEIEDGTYIPDELGRGFENDDAARREAQSLYDDLNEERRSGEPLHIRITKEDSEEFKDGFRIRTATRSGTRPALASISW